MDISRLIYKELFTIKLLHTGSATSTSNALLGKLKITPDTDTQKLFRRYSMDYRWLNNSIVCFIRSEYVLPPAREPKKPFITLTENFGIRFLVTAQAEFISNTFITTAGKEAVYYFTNKVDNVKSGRNFLSKPVENFLLTKNYDAGTLVKSGGDLFTTLQPVNALDFIPITNADYWKKLAPVEDVVNNADLGEVSSLKPEQTCFAVIEIFNSGISNSVYNLFDSGQELLSPVYTISFKSKI